MQHTGAITLADAVFPRLKTNNRTASIARDVALMIGFALFVALCAQIAVRVPWTTVPITMQTFGVLVTGGTLGMKRGVGALTIYMLLGFFLPVYAPGNTAMALSGTWDAHFIFPWVGTHNFVWDISSGGYIVGFILAAGVVGYLSERKQWDRKPLKALGQLFLGNVLVYVPGLLWLSYLIGSSWVHPVGKPLADLISGTSVLGKTLNGGLWTFIPGDITKLVLASLAIPSVWAIVQKFKKAQGNPR